MYQVASSLRRRRYPCGYFADQPFHQLWSWLNGNTGVLPNVHPSMISWFLPTNYISITFPTVFKNRIYLFNFNSFKTTFEFVRWIWILDRKYFYNTCEIAYSTPFYSFPPPRPSPPRPIPFPLLLQNVNETDTRYYLHARMYSFSISIAQSRIDLREYLSFEKTFRNTKRPLYLWLVTRSGNDIL